jgi:hypothetical protein
MTASLQLIADSGAADVLSDESKYVITSTIADVLNVSATDVFLTGLSWFSNGAVRRRQLLASRYIFFAVKLEALTKASLTTTASVTAALTASVNSGALIARLAASAALAKDLAVSTDTLLSNRPVFSEVRIEAAAAPIESKGTVYVTAYDSRTLGAVFGTIGGVVAILLAVIIRWLIRRRLEFIRSEKASEELFVGAGPDDVDYPKDAGASPESPATTASNRSPRSRAASPQADATCIPTFDKWVDDVAGCMPISSTTRTPARSAAASPARNATAITVAPPAAESPKRRGSPSEAYVNESIYANQ